MRLVQKHYPGYEPANAEHVERMEKFMSGAETKEELATASVLYIFDMTYARQDIATVVSAIERERGWR